MLEIAMAKKELDDALKNLDALGSFEEGLALLVESTGMKLQDLINMANAIKSGEDIAITSTGGGGGSKKTGTDGEDLGDVVAPPAVTEGAGFEALARNNAVVITQNINVEGKDANAQALDIIDALNRAKRNGQRVIF